MPNLQCKIAKRKVVTSLFTYEPTTVSNVIKSTFLVFQLQNMLLNFDGQSTFGKLFFKTMSFCSCTLRGKGKTNLTIHFKKRKY